MNSNFREFSFQFIFHLQLPIYEKLKEQYSDQLEDELKETLVEFQNTSSTEVSPDALDKAFKLVEKTLKHHQDIEASIKPWLKNWTLERISKVDKTILVLAACELTYFKQTPMKVVINEAIELGKKYGTPESPAFINGVLDNLAKKND